MAKTKADYLEEAKSLGLDLSSKNTVAEIKQALDEAAQVRGEKDSPVQEHEGPSETSAKSDKEYAKAGKRSQKAVKEAEDEAARKQLNEDESSQNQIKKNPAPKTRSRLARRGKKYQQAHKLIDQSQTYNLDQAMAMAVKTTTTNFDASVEIHLRLNVDPRQADQNIRGTVVLPEGTGRQVRVAVFAGDEETKKALDAGADFAGNQDFLKKLDKEEIDFDVLISTPDHMAMLSKYARLLGPRGLMPNPKSGTVSTDVESAVREAKAGKIEYRVDESGIIHAAIGKVSFGTDRLSRNASVLIESISAAKPASIKGALITSSYLTTTMGPSVKFEA